MDIYSAEVLTETELKDFKKWLTKNKNKLEDSIEKAYKKKLTDEYIKQLEGYRYE